jgi:hypothetical protein
MASPNPWLTFAVRADKGKRLWVVDYDTVVVDMGEPCKSFIDVEIELLFSIGKSELGSLQGVVKAFCNFKELLAAVKYSPARVNTNIVHQQDQRVQNFSDAAALVRCVQVNDMLVVKPSCSFVDFSKGVIRYDGTKVL